MSAVKDNQWNTRTDKIYVPKCWEEHLNAHLNTVFLHQPTAIDEIPGPQRKQTTFRQFIKRNSSRLSRKWKKNDIDSITEEVHKAVGKPMTKMLRENVKCYLGVWEKLGTYAGHPYT